MAVFIAVVVVLAVLIYFMAVMLRSVISQANQQVNGYFSKNLEIYDERYRDTIHSMNQMHMEQESLSRELRGLKNEMISYRTSPFYAPRPLERDVYIPTARYVDNDFFEEYKTVKDKLQSIDKRSVIENVKNVVPFTGDMDRYELACGIVEKLNFDALYDLCTSQKEEQLQVLQDCLEPKEQKLLLEYIDDMTELDEFNVLSFLDYVRKVGRDNDPHLFVYVGVNEKDYSNPEKGIVCDVDTNICEGLKIIYQNKVYDYSIYKTRRKVGS
ncbi:MAG: hypothetical protein MR355_01005 [Lachnospiraceae bacterium]|nr:hypothetical protein [Lachnospiraceae bacterium]